MCKIIKAKADFRQACKFLLKRRQPPPIYNPKRLLEKPLPELSSQQQNERKIPSSAKPSAKQGATLCAASIATSSATCRINSKNVQQSKSHTEISSMDFSSILVPTDITSPKQTAKSIFHLIFLNHKR